MLISVIIPTCNRNDLLIKCLDLLSPERQTVNLAYEVIVTDDSKSDEAKNLIADKYKWATWMAGPKRGPASNRNYGAKQVKAEWLVFIDDDCLPEKDILAQYVQGISQYPDSLAFEGAILPDNWDKLKEDMSECPVTTEGGYFWSANICVKASVFDQINGFDETFLIAAQEDQDIYKRLLKITKVTFIKEAVVVHPVRKIPLSKKVSKIPISTRNWFLYEKKYNKQSLSRIFLMWGKFMIEFSKGTIKNLLKGKVKTAIFLFCHLIVGIPVYLKLAFNNYINE
jgi:GT2 family glycosyltransferase